MFSKKVAYAIRCLVFLAEKDEPVIISKISEAADVPYPFLAKIVNIMTRKGFLKSQRGIGGGITLARKPDSISLYDISQIFDDPILDSQCVIGMPECSDETACPIHPFWSKQNERIQKYLLKTTLTSIVLARRKKRVSVKK